MDLARKRTAVACNYCRRRKRRCDGGKPACTLCDEAGVECNYEETEGQRSAQEDTFSALFQRLGDIEALLREHSSTLSSLSIQQPRQQVSTPFPPSSHVSPQVFIEPLGSFIHNSPTSLVATGPQDTQNAGEQAHSHSPSFTSELNLPPMTIPTGHLTTTGSLLMSENVKTLLGEFPVDVFLDTEARRHLPSELSLSSRSIAHDELPVLESHSTDHLVEKFFSFVHSETPILDERAFMILYRSVLQVGLQADPDSALCLVVLALGSVALDQSYLTDVETRTWAPGSQYISAALPIMTRHFMNSFGSTIVLPQALYLAAKYFGYLARPLQSWRLVHMASTNLQHLLNQHKRLIQSSGSTQKVQTIIRVSWAVFGLECDLIAEHHLPRSGIENVIDLVAFPLCGSQPPKEILCWLAELSIRRLLNRVHHVMYGNDFNAAGWTNSVRLSEGQSPFHRSVPSLLKVSAELERQLETWFDLLPQTIKEDLNESSAWTFYELNISLRYHSAKDIIFRPFVMYACNLPPGSELPSIFLANCRTCISSCRAYLDVADKRLEMPSSSGEVIIHSTFAVAVVLTLASLCPLLTDLVPDIDALQLTAISTIKRLAFQGSCIESMLWILTTMQVKAKMLRKFTEPIQFPSEDDFFSNVESVTRSRDNTIA